MTNQSWWELIGKSVNNCRLVDISPDLANEWLSNRAVAFNRKPSKYNIDIIVKQINDGSWMINGETIVFDKYGSLIDGQHRLKAIAQSGKTVASYVIFEIESSAFITIDTGKVRSASDALSIEGIPNHKYVAAVCRKLINYEKGCSISMLGNEKPSNHEVSKCVQRHPLINETITYCHRYRSMTGFITAVMFVHYITKMCTNNTMKHSGFWRSFETGENISVGNPVHTLRETLLRRKSTRSTKITEIETIAFIFKAWNYYTINKSIALLKFNIYNEESPYPNNCNIFSSMQTKGY
jgi:hypothetical protein